MTHAPDPTCPVCDRPASADGLEARLRCGRCEAYHHAACWWETDRCAECGHDATIPDPARQTSGARLRMALIGVTLGGVGLAVVAARVLPPLTPSCCIIGGAVCVTVVAAMPILGRLSR
jgi:hypothetical protein